MGFVYLSRRHLERTIRCIREEELQFHKGYSEARSERTGDTQKDGGR